MSNLITNLFIFWIAINVLFVIGLITTSFFVDDKEKDLSV